MSTLFLDSETHCEIPIKNGHHAYAEKAEVLLLSYAWDDDKAHVVDLTLRPEFLGSLQGMVDRAEKVVIHNSQFDRTVLAPHGIVIPTDKIHDTMVHALLHSLPGALEKLCDILQVPRDLAKDKDGKKLIRLFCMPLPKNQKLRRATRETHPEKWADFIEYARFDIISMREVYKRLPTWNWTDTEQALWRLDQIINDRGFAIDVEMAHAALRAADRTSKRLAKVIDGLTGGEVSSVTQRARTLAYVTNVLGYDMLDLKAATVEAALAEDDLDPAVREVLDVRAEGAATSPSKYSAALRSVSPDGRVKGTIQFCGAMRTGRDAGRVLQPQNFPRPKLKQAEIEVGIEAMKLDVEDLLYVNVMELCTSALRGLIVAKPGHKLVIADLSNIEGRMLAWLAGEHTKIERFKAFDNGTGPDVYLSTAGGILGKRPEDVTRDERQAYGKVPELALGYQGAVGAFLQMAAGYGVNLPEEQVLEIVKGWRKQHPETRKFWYAAEASAIAAVKNPGKAYKAGRLTFQYAKHEFMPALMMKLPSGRYLCYPFAEIQGGIVPCGTCEGAKVVQMGGLMEDPSPPRREVCPECKGDGFIDLGDERLLYQGVNQYTRQWGVIDTYGGKLAENGDQGASRDIFYHGARKAEAAGYRIVGRVHDELITEVPDSDEFTAEALSAMMAGGPLWSLGLPLAAAGHEAYRYGKAD